jgi:hypothetical protein
MYKFSILEVGQVFLFAGFTFTKLTNYSAYNHQEHQTEFFIDGDLVVQLITLGW